MSDKADEWQGLGKAHRSLNDVVAEALRNAILSGRFKPGERLPESQLADMFGVSRNPIRDALLTLSHEGLIEINRRKGARVAMLSLEEIAETIELRAELEGVTARYAARHRDTAKMALMRELLADGDAACERGDMEALTKLNDKFHAELAIAGKNRYLAEFMRSLRDRTYWLFSSQASSRAIDSWKEHAGVLEAVIAADEKKAAKLASAHVTKVGDALLRDLRLQGYHVVEEDAA